MCRRPGLFFFNDTATTEIYTLSLHDALPISISAFIARYPTIKMLALAFLLLIGVALIAERSEEHTSELQSQSNLVCRLLLEKKNFIGTGSRATRVRRSGGHVRDPLARVHRCA